MTAMATPRTKDRRNLATRDAWSIREFCHQHGFSLTFFYKYRDKMPVVIDIGGRRMITREAAEQWRREETNKAIEAAEEAA
jgi:hypothetical protein